MYNKFSEKYSIEKKAIESNLLNASQRVSDLLECVELGIKFTLKMPFKWLSADYLTKQKIQYLIFPEGIFYNRKNDECRTTRINSLFLYLAYLQQIISNKKRGIPELSLDFASLADLVEGSGKCSNFHADVQAIVSAKKIFNTANGYQS